MKSIPLVKTASQVLSVTLSDQVVGLYVFQRRTGLYMSVYNDGTLIIGAVICQNQNRIVRSEYLGFVGDFVWYDNEGLNDPDYTGIGSRFFLLYLTPEEIAQYSAS